MNGYCHFDDVILIAVLREKNRADLGKQFRIEKIEHWAYFGMKVHL